MRDLRVSNRRSLWIAMIVGVALTSCDSTPVEFDDPDDPDPDDVPTRVVSVQVHVDPAGADLASALGWETGVPEAEVGLRALGTDEWVTMEADDSGLAAFEDISSGRYRLAGSRVLSSSEADAADSAVRGLGDGRIVEIQGDEEFTLEMLPDRGGGLVISELQESTPLPWETEGARHGGLAVEIYNGSDEVVFLDGMLVGSTYVWNTDTPTHPCTETHDFRQSPEGVYSVLIQRFPGEGSDHPLEPGGVAVIAEAAIDHRPVHPDLPDLREAQFEIVKAGAGNNPEVPDMDDVGPMGWTDTALFGGNAVFLAHAVDVADLPMLRDAHSGTDFVRIPAEVLADVVSRRTTYPDVADPDLCPGGMVHRSFDRLHFPRPTTETNQPRTTLQRRFLRYADDGRAILQNTNTSAVDFVLGERSLGTLPDS